MAALLPIAHVSHWLWVLYIPPVLIVVGLDRLDDALGTAQARLDAVVPRSTLIFRGAGG